MLLLLKSNFLVFSVTQIYLYELQYIFEFCILKYFKTLPWVPYFDF